MYRSVVRKNIIGVRVLVIQVTPLSGRSTEDVDTLHNVEAMQPFSVDVQSNAVYLLSGTTTRVDLGGGEHRKVTAEEDDREEGRRCKIHNRNTRAYICDSTRPRHAERWSKFRVVYNYFHCTLSTKW